MKMRLYYNKPLLPQSIARTYKMQFYDIIKENYFTTYHELYPLQTAGIKHKFFSVLWKRAPQTISEDLNIHNEIMSIIQHIENTFAYTDMDKSFLLLEKLVLLAQKNFEDNGSKLLYPPESGKFLRKMLCKLFKITDKNYTNYNAGMEYKTYDQILLHQLFNKHLNEYKKKTTVVQKRLTNIIGDNNYVNLIKFLEKEGKLNALMKMPPWAICPLSKTLLVIPVLFIKNGHTYEKIWLNEYLSKDDNIPLKEEISSQSKLKYIENSTLKSAIENICENFVKENTTDIIAIIGKDKFEEFISTLEVSSIAEKGIRFS
jgi:hypothetical protein